MRKYPPGPSPLPSCCARARSSADPGGSRRPAPRDRRSGARPGPAWGRCRSLPPRATRTCRTRRSRTRSSAGSEHELELVHRPRHRLVGLLQGVGRGVLPHALGRVVGVPGDVIGPLRLGRRPVALGGLEPVAAERARVAVPERPLDLALAVIDEEPARDHGRRAVQGRVVLERSPTALAVQDQADPDRMVRASGPRVDLGERGEAVVSAIRSRWSGRLGFQPYRRILRCPSPMPARSFVADVESVSPAERRVAPRCRGFTVRRPRAPRRGGCFAPRR